MLFADVPPDTSVYMIAGYVIFFVVTAIYVASLYVRTNNLSRDLDTLKDVQEQQKTPAVEPARPASAPKPGAAKPRTARAKGAKPKSAKAKPASRKTSAKR